MKSWKVLAAILLFSCALPATDSGAVEVEETKFTQEFGPVQAERDATVGTNPDGTIEVGNIGSSGLDGVRMDLGQTRGAIGPVRWMAPESLEGRGLTVVVSGMDSLGAVFDFSVSYLGNALGSQDVTVDPLTTAATQVSLTVFRNGNPMYQGNGTLGTMPLYESSLPPEGAGSGLSGQEYPDFGLGDFAWIYPAGTSVRIPGEPLSFEADAVRIDFLDGAPGMKARTSVKILGTEPVGSVGSLTILTFPGTFFNHTVGRLGQAVLTGTEASGGPTLTVDNIGSSGLDGVSVARRDFEGGLGLALEPLVPANGSRLILAGVTGQPDDGSASPLPEVTCSYADSVFQLRATSPVLDPPVRVEFLRDGVVVDAATDPALPVDLFVRARGTLPPAPVVFPQRVQAADSNNGTFLECFVMWAAPLHFTGSDGKDNDCDGVHFVFGPGSWPSFHSFDGVSLAAADLAGGTMTVTGCPNEIGPQTGAVAIGSAQAVGAASVEMVSGPALLVRDLPPGELAGVLLTPDSPTDNYGMAIEGRKCCHGHVTVLKSYVFPAFSASGTGNLVRATSTWDGAQYQFAADTTPLGTVPVTLNLYDGGALVGTVICAGTPEACLTTEFAPVSLSASVDGNGGGGVVRVRAGHTRGAMTYPGAKGVQTTVMADMVEMVIDDPSLPEFTGVAGLSWEIQNGEPEFLVTAAGASALSDVRVVPEVGGGMVLHAPSPNPFNPRTEIAFDLRHDAEVSLRIFDLRGMLVRNLFQGARAAGEYRTVWDGLDDGGRAVSSGLYFIRLRSGEDVQVQKAALVR